MKEYPIPFLKFVKYSGVTVSALLVSGIVALVIISRGKGEDITGVVAPAFLITFVAGVAAIIAAFLQRRAEKATKLKEKGKA